MHELMCHRLKIEIRFKLSITQFQAIDAKYKKFTINCVMQFIGVTWVHQSYIYKPKMVKLDFQATMGHFEVLPNKKWEKKLHFKVVVKIALDLARGYVLLNLHFLIIFQKKLFVSCLLPNLLLTSYLQHCQCGYKIFHLDLKNLMSIILGNQVVRVYMLTLTRLSYLHSQNIVHRDVKTENMLLDNIRTLKLLILGLLTLKPSNKYH